MFVVMAPAATEDQINSVKSHILAEGLTPYEHQGAERLGVHLGPQRVPAGRGHQDAVGQAPPGAGHDGLQRVDGVDRRLVPQVLGEGVGRHGPAAGEREPGHEGAAHRTAEIDLAVAVEHPHGAEHAHLHPTILPCPTPRRPPPRPSPAAPA